MSLSPSAPQVLYRVPLLAGTRGTAQTIDKIRELVNDALSDPAIATYAMNVIMNSGVQPHDEMGEVMAIWRDARSYHFIKDVYTKEVLHPTRELIEVRAGDCDDINAILLPSVLGAAGYEVRLVTVAADSRDPEQFSHIYSEVNVGGQWIPLDAARPGAQFGMAPPRYYKRWWWSLEDGSHFDYPGHGLIAPMNLGCCGPRYGMGDLTPAQAISGIGVPLLTASAQIATAVNGQPVASPYGVPIGPGGYAIPGSAPAVAVAPAPSSNLTPIFILLGLGLAAWALM